jgi:hypothetical protein
VNKAAEQSLANWLLLGLAVGWGALIALRRSAWKTKGIAEARVVAGVMAYACYVAAALLAGAKFPGFLREHLFDGLAPAAAVLLLVNSFPVDRPRTAFPWIRRPVIILVVLFAGGALIFGLIGAAAVIASGIEKFASPVTRCAVLGGWLFSVGYFLVAGSEEDGRRRPEVQWWFRKRPRQAATPVPGGPEGAAILAAMNRTRRRRDIPRS